MISDLDLSPRQSELYTLLFGRGDVGIDRLYREMNGPADKAEATLPKGRSYAQVWIGSYIAKLNRKLKVAGMKVEPGALKRTYRLVKTEG